MHQPQINQIISCQDHQNRHFYCQLQFFSPFLALFALFLFYNINRNRNRPPTQLKMSSLKCTLHPSQPLSSFCDSCRDAVCSLCTQLGPHADLRHHIMSIDQAANIRKMFYFAYRDKEIYPTIQKAWKHLGEISKQEEAISKERKVIEKDIKIQFEGIVNRIEHMVARRIIKKQTQIKNYQEVLNRLQDLMYSFDGVMRFPQRFLLCYRQFHQQLKHLQSLTLNIHSPALDQALTMKTVDLKAITNSWKIQAVEPQQLQLPREMALSFARANQLPQYVQKNKFMNALVGKAVQNYHKQLNNAKKEVVLSKKRILSLYNDTNSSLLKLQKAMVCAYCLTAFSVQQSNEACSYNKTYKSEPSYKDVDVPVEVRGGKRHYWVPARKNQRPIPDIKTHSLVRGLHKKQYKNSLKDIREVVCKLKMYDIQKSRQDAYLQQFTKNDPQNTGKVTPLTFLFIMTNKFQIQQIQVQVLSQLCLDKQDQMINYQKMGQILKNPLQLFELFEAEQDDYQKKKPTAPPSFKFRY